MKPDERRKVEELVTIYTVETSLRDVFVEGEADKAILEAFLRTFSPRLSHVAVHEIDSINIPGNVVRGLKMEPGNRSEVITLCALLEAEFGPEFEGATGIIDADFDYVLASSELPSLVLRTDYACTEMYFFTPDVLQKLLTVCFPNTRATGEELMQELVPPLHRLFLIRIAADKLKLSCEWPELKNFVTVAHHHLKFDETGFVRRLLSSRGKIAKFQEVLSQVKELEPRLPKELRRAVNGHDLMELLALYLGHYHTNAVAKERLRPAALWYNYVLCGDLSNLHEEGLFRQLTARLAASSTLE